MHTSKPSKASSSHSVGKTPLRKQRKNAPDRDRGTKSGWNSRLDGSGHGALGRFSELSPYQRYVRRRAEVRIVERTRTKGLVATPESPEPDFSVVGCTTIPYRRFQAMGSRYLQQWGYFKAYFESNNHVMVGGKQMSLETFARTRPVAGCIRTSEWDPRDVLCWTAMCVLFKVSYAGKHDYSWGQFTCPSSDYTAACLVRELVESPDFLAESKKFAFRFGKWRHQVRQHRPVIKKRRHKPTRFDVKFDTPRIGLSAKKLRKDWRGQNCAFQTHKESQPTCFVTSINGRNFNFPPIVKKALRRILINVVLIPKLPRRVERPPPTYEPSSYTRPVEDPNPPPMCDLSNYRTGLVLTDRYYSTSSGVRNVLRARFPNEYLRFISQS